MIPQEFTDGVWASDGSDKMKNTKAEFVWLGYSLKLTKEGFLVFTENRMNRRFGEAESKMHDCFQYIRCLFLRWRIWNVYISPIIEWFIPVIFTKPTHDLATANTIEIYQHKTLAVAAKASRYVSRKGLEDAMATMPVKMKTRRVANRMDDLIFRRDADMAAITDPDFRPVGITTRSGIALGADQGMSTIWPGAERRDLGDRIFILRKQYECYTAEEIDKYSRKNENRIKFDVSTARAWVRAANGQVSHHTKNRLLRAEQGF